MDPTAPNPLSPFSTCRPQGVGRTLHRIIEILEEHGNLTHRQMLEYISDELEREQLGE